ncbi:hypothetical protein [Coleofasciculus sp.]|uniref:hypothetical protein n=1 Tax=Coleofasciculus sp. TaxID=3100458 RepID=UPI003A3AF5E8
MAVNEKAICEFLFSNIGHINLKHIGILQKIGIPDKNYHGYRLAESLSDISTLSTTDSRKKADIYLNSKGVSLKQAGSSFSFNRLQRANLIQVYSRLGLAAPQTILTQLDQEIHRFHQGLLSSRDRPWHNFFSENDFKTLLKFLMMLGSPNLGMSQHPAELILEAPATQISRDTIKIYSFDEYFNCYKERLHIAIRRQWIGQTSKSEHGRAISLAKKPDNVPWVFDDVVGTPRGGWRNDIDEADRKTVYFLMIEKKK